MAILQRALLRIRGDPDLLRRTQDTGALGVCPSFHSGC